MKTETGIAGLEIEESDLPNADYKNGIFRINGVEIGRALKYQGLWRPLGGLKTHTDQEMALALLRTMLLDANVRHNRATVDAAFARESLAKFKASKKPARKIT